MTSPDAAADAAWAAGDALRVTAAALGSRVLRQAADSFDRAARQQYGRIPDPTPAGNRLRYAARLISAYAYITHDRTFSPLLLIVRLAALAEAVADLREAQQRAHQAEPALRAAGHLHAYMRTTTGPGGKATTKAREERPPPATAAGRIAAESFPASPFKPGSKPPPAAQSGTTRRRPPGRSPPRRRGPAR